MSFPRFRLGFLGRILVVTGIAHLMLLGDLYFENIHKPLGLQRETFSKSISISERNRIPSLFFLRCNPACDSRDSSVLVWDCETVNRPASSLETQGGFVEGLPALKPTFRT